MKIGEIVEIGERVIEVPKPGAPRRSPPTPAAPRKAPTKEPA